MRLTKLPENWGQCFDVAALVFLRGDGIGEGARLCHGIGRANYPPEDVGKLIKHAWIEQNGRAYDVVWEVQQDRDDYRKNLQLSKVVEYTKAEAWEHWIKTDMPGPWDPEIAAIKSEKD